MSTPALCIVPAIKEKVMMTIAQLTVTPTNYATRMMGKTIVIAMDAGGMPLSLVGDALNSFAANMLVAGSAASAMIPA